MRAPRQERDGAHAIAPDGEGAWPAGLELLLRVTFLRAAGSMHETMDTVP
jgi:hypothetical protein